MFYKETINMEVRALSKRYYVRELGENDVDMIHDMSSKNHTFYQYHPPFVTKESILADMAALPPGKSADDKFYVGYFEKESLVGIMDLILDYPEKGIAFIGLFMVNTQYQNSGVGSEIIGEVIMCLKSLSYKEIRLGVDKGNPQSHAFWTKNHFAAISEAEYILMGLKI